MRNITINRKNNTIEITKAFDKASSNPLNEEYTLLQTVRKDNPGYKVVVKSTKQKKETYKGLTYEYMEMYIEKHDDEAMSIMAEYKMMRGQTEEGMEALAVSASYFEVKEWFFMTFPEIEAFHKKREELLETIKKSKENRKAEAAKKAA